MATETPAVVARRRTRVAIVLFVAGAFAVAGGLTVLPWGYELDYPANEWNPLDRDLVHQRLDYTNSDGGPSQDGMRWYVQRGAFVVAALATAAAAVAAFARRAARIAAVVVLLLALVHYFFSVYWTTFGYRFGIGPWVMLCGYLMAAAACFLLAPSRKRSRRTAVRPADSRHDHTVTALLGLATVLCAAATVWVGSLEATSPVGDTTDTVSCGSVLDIAADIDNYTCSSDLWVPLVVTAALLGLTVALATVTAARVAHRPVRRAAVVGVGAGAALLAGATWGLILYAAA